MAVTWTEIDDFTCDIEDLHWHPENASEVASRFKDLVLHVNKEGIEKED